MCRKFGRFCQDLWVKQVNITFGTGNVRGQHRFQFIINIQVKMANVNIKPLADRVLVEPAAAEEKTAFGIIIPDTAKEKPQKGKIVAVGEGKIAENGNVVKSQLKVGDTVLYGKYSGTEITVDGTEYLIMRETDIFAVI